MCLEESVSGGVGEPGVLVGAAHTGVHYDLVARQLLGGEFAGVGHQAVLPGPGGALLLPGGEVLGIIHADRGLHPEEDLGHGDKVDLLVVLQSLLHPVEESVEELSVVLQPG